MITKKDLELRGRKKVSHNTVTTTLKACGLDTSRRSYTEEEISERYDVARRMYEAGKTTREIEEYFEMKSGGQKDSGVPAAGAGVSPSESGSSELQLKEQIAQEMGKAVQGMVNSVAREVISHIPTMTGAAFKSLVENGSVKEAFSEYQKEVANLPLNFESHPETSLLEADIEYEVVPEPHYGTTSDEEESEEAQGEVSEVRGD